MRGEFGTGVAALPAGRAIRGEQPGRVEAGQEGGLHSQQVGGPSHGVGRVALVELGRCALLP